jgi:hypothetical protein
MEVLKTTKVLKVANIPCPNGISKKNLIHPPKHAIFFLRKVLNTVIHRQYFPPV